MILTVITIMINNDIIIITKKLTLVLFFHFSANCIIMFLQVNIN